MNRSSTASRSSAAQPPSLSRVLTELEPVRARLLGHPVYAAVDSAESVRVFLEHHVFAVWDFMSLAKAVQRRLTCVDVPWTPRGDAASRRFINEIVLGEESDDDGRGGFMSHFELYLDAMRDAGATTQPIDAFLEYVARGEGVDASLDSALAPPPSKAFVRTTFRILSSGSLPAITAAFTLGREDVIPAMFRSLIARLHGESPGRFSRLVHYLERHVDVDENRHGPMARRLLATVTGEDVESWSQARRAAEESLEARVALWDGVHEACIRARRS